MQPKRRFDRGPAGTRSLDLANVFDRQVSLAAFQSQLDLASLGPAYGGTSAGGSIVLDRHGHILHTLDVYNNSGADGQVHIGGRFNALQADPVTGAADTDYLWGAGQWDHGAGGNDYADDSPAAKDLAVGDFPLTAAVNDGFVVHSTRLFDCIVAQLSTAQVNQAGTTHEWTYWNGAAWAGLQLITPAVTFAALGEHAIVFVRPLNWALTTATGPAEGVPVGRYAIRYRATTQVVGTVGLATSILVGRMRYSRRLVPAGGAILENDIGWPVCGLDEHLWVVVGDAAGGWTVKVGTELNGMVHDIGVNSP